MNAQTDQIVREALLDNGHIVEYDVFSRDKQAFSDRFYKYLGVGVIYRINGLTTNDTGKKHFWVKKEKEKP